MITELKELLENKDDIYLEFVEPWPAFDSVFDEVDAHIILRATVADCINIQRFANKTNNRQIRFSDEELLDQFIVVNWATVYG